jgi:hypothetical protein
MDDALGPLGLDNVPVLSVQAQQGEGGLFLDE